ncbi:MAG: pyrroloquinoline quinone biosynthesis protein PqqE [Methanosaeta sp. PtaU1.Bin060]|nr:MAG: pyrroloquinoline quinone biosynthesis protein PqqE [Methanosaeta sp. PtaU1.Bin060]
MRSFSPHLAARALWQMRVKRRPFVLSHGINAACNLRCRFCEYWRKPGTQMSTPEIFSMLDDARSFGIGVYNAWTLEPLLRRDLPEILRHAKRLGLVTSLITNGLLLRQRAHELEDLDLLSVSVDGTTSYRELRGADLEEVLEGIRAARDEGHEVLMNCVISQKNVSELEELVHLAESLGAWISFEPIHESQGIDDAVWDEIGIRDTFAYERAVEDLMERKRRGAPIINSLTYLEMIKSRRPRFRCHASDIILHVSPSGIIENCRVHQEPLGMVSDGISRVWDATLKKRKGISQSCKGCLFFGYVENSLLYEFVPEVMAHYEWM